MNIKADQLPDDLQKLKGLCMKLIADNNRLEGALLRAATTDMVPAVKCGYTLV